MITQFEYLFKPLKINRIEVKNRIHITAHTTLFARDGMIDDWYIEYLAKRAEGGIGSITAGMFMVHPQSHGFGEVQKAYDKEVLPKFRRLSEAIHQYDCKVFAQLCHCGRQQTSSWSRQPILAPSPIQCPGNRETPKEMDREDIENVIAGFAKSARHAREGGMDGVELHSTTGYLIQQFLSPFTNKRTDEYGGELENRMRFLTEILDAVRKEVGYDFVVGIRIVGDEFIEGGLTLDDTKDIVKRLIERGDLDYFSIMVGNYASILSGIIPMNMEAPLGYLVYLSAAIREISEGIPVIANGRINDPIQAEKILADGQADLIGMARALICDPEFANKAKRGALDDIRTCIACSQGCFGRLFANKPISCLQNAAVGKEIEIGTIQSARNKKRIMVVGGGPAGMEVARVASLRGHEVILYEQSDELGGQVNLAAKAPGREEFGGVTRYLIKQMESLKVDIRQGIKVSQDLIERDNPDVVVLATGAMPQIPPIPYGNGLSVANIEDCLLNRIPIGKNVLLVDEDGHYRAVSTADFLLEKEVELTIITNFLCFGFKLLTSNEVGSIYARLLEKGVKIIPNTAFGTVSNGCIRINNIFSRQEEEIHGIDTIVFASPLKANDQLYRELNTEGRREVYAVGDCVAPRLCMDAIYDAYNLGRIL